MTETELCPNCQSNNTTQYLYGDTTEYAFTICHDCDEEFEEESMLQGEDDD